MNNLVGLLRFKFTHLPLRQRARLVLQQEKQSCRPLPADFHKKVQAALYATHNRVAFEQRKYPSWQHLPQEIRDGLLKRFPLSGTGMADMNAFLYLQQREKEAMAAITQPALSVNEAEVDVLIAAYLEQYPPVKS